VAGVTTSPTGWLLARFSVPALVLIFYATAALHFPYTPDGTYASVRETHTVLTTGTSPSSATPGLPLVLLAAAGRALKLDPILVSKVFSLLSSSIALLLVYLLAVEVAGDRVFALCATVVITGQGWLLRWAASGSGMGLFFLLVVTALFFLQRNEYLLAVVCVAAASLMSWYAAGLMVGVVTDVLVNSRDRRRGIMVAFASTMVFLVMILPWVLYATWAGLPVVTGTQPLETGLGESAAVMASLTGAGVLALGLLLREPGSVSGRHPLLQLSGLLWAAGWSLAVGYVWDGEALSVAVVVLVILGFAGLARMLRRLSGDQSAYGPAILAAAGLLLVTQAEFLTVTRPAMDRTIADNDDLTSIAYWIRSGVPEGATLAAERPGFLSYVLGREIPGPSRGERPEYMVSSADDLPGYEMVYRPAPELPSADEAKHFKIWRKL
jgi:hypothetical protein